MAGIPESRQQGIGEFYCPVCNRAVSDPLVCGDCMAVICRRCGAPLERVDDLGMG